jgi:ABC-type bacteriocin/lantibiotic exporter with double-glycine peptidase domain
VLDEPTSALDSENEALVERSLSGIPPHSIVVVASHRPALLGRCNHFVVLEHGRVVAQGDAAAVDLAGRVRG